MNTPNFSSLDYADSVPLNTLLRHIIPLVPKLPQAMALDMLRQKYISFARRTKILSYECIQNYQAGVTDYYLTAPKDHDIFSIVGIEGGQYGYYWYGEQRVAFKRNFDVRDNNCVILRSPPSIDEVNGLKIYVILIPQSCIGYIPSSIAGPYGLDIAKGVVSDALRIPNKDWTRIDLSRRYELDYEKMLLSARALAMSNRKIDSTSFQPVRIL